MIRSYSCVFFWLGLTIATSLVLYHTSDRVAALDREMRVLNRQIDTEQQRIHVLKAEWVYLSNPTRIEAEAKRHLGLTPTSTKRIASMDTFGTLLASREGGNVSSLPAAAPRMVAAATPAAPAPRTKRDRIVATLNAGRINDHMTLQHAASARAEPDKIGTLINTLSIRP